MINNIPILRCVLASFLLGIPMNLGICLVAGERLKFKHLVLSSLLTSLYVFFVSVYISPDSPFKFLFTCLFTVLLLVFIVRLRGRLLLIRCSEVLLASFIGDVVGGILLMQLFTSEQITEMRYLLSPLTYMLQIISGSSILFFALIWSFARRLIRNRSTRQRVGYLIRPVLMLGLTSAMFAKTLLTMPEGDQVVRLKHLLPDFIMITLLLVCCITYVAQDIRYYQQLLHNQRLLHQQSLQDLLFQDMRLFRHNISNMLHGLQGMILSNDTQALRRYYQNMVVNCQIINNENVVALRRLPSPPVSALLINKMQKANDMSIPFFITVTEGIGWYGLREEEMTQVIGALLDNAIEAASESDAPHVSFEAENQGDALILTIRNTYKGEPPVFHEHIRSSKEGHEGLGLHGVRRIIARSRSGAFNIYTCGRYVEASVALR